MIINRSLFKLIGIYCIKNILNNKEYVGSSKNIYNRLHTHRKLLLINNHHNKHLQAAWNKYGSEAFTCCKLECCELEKLIEREVFHIKNRKPQYNKNLNPTKAHSHTYTEKEKKELSDLMKKRYKDGIHKKAYKKIFVYSLTGEFLFCRKGLLIFAEELKTTLKQISKGLKSKCGRFRKYQLRYENDKRPVTDIRYNKDKPKIAKIYLTKEQRGRIMSEARLKSNNIPRKISKIQKLEIKESWKRVTLLKRKWRKNMMSINLI